MRAISPTNILAQKHEKGATSVEYVVMLVSITVVIILTVALLGTNTRDAFDAVKPAFTAVSPPAEENKCKDKDSDDDPDCGIGNDDKD
ncbi:MAG TPA: hypothetical protein VIR78_05745 [Malonomonas sp.]